MTYFSPRYDKMCGLEGVCPAELLSDYQCKSGSSAAAAGGPGGATDCALGYMELPNKCGYDDTSCM